MVGNTVAVGSVGVSVDEGIAMVGAGETMMNTVAIAGGEASAGNAVAVTVADVFGDFCAVNKHSDRLSTPTIITPAKIHTCGGMPACSSRCGCARLTRLRRQKFFRCGPGDGLTGGKVKSRSFLADESINVAIISKIAQLTKRESMLRCFA